MGQDDPFVNIDPKTGLVTVDNVKVKKRALELIKTKEAERKYEIKTGPAYYGDRAGGNQYDYFFRTPHDMIAGKPILGIPLALHIQVVAIDQAKNQARMSYVVLVDASNP